MRTAVVYISLFALLCAAGCRPPETGNSMKEYEEKLDPLVYSADKDYMTQMFGEPTKKSKDGNLDIWNYHISLANQGSSSSSEWYSNTSTSPFEKYHDITLYFKADTLIKWKADIRD